MEEMKLITNLLTGRRNIMNAIMRFPLTAILLVAAAITRIISTAAGGSLLGTGRMIYLELTISFLLGALVSAVGQLTYERFFRTKVLRYAYMGTALIFALAYYVAIRNTDFDNMKIAIRTMVIFFVLFILFLWIPVIHHKYHFNQSVMAAFKAFFISLFFNGVLYLGIVLILGATDLLIAKLNGQIYYNTATIIFYVLAPIYFLSILPQYSEEEEGEERTLKLVAPTRFLEVLISYIIIPLTVIFTAILVIYILINITGEFWSDNLMEPLLIAYTLTVIIIYLLSCSMQNKIALYFCKVFPKILLPIVLFQTIASILKINEVGVTYGRYYVILFGVFAIIAGGIFSVLPIRKNGWIAPILIVLSIISILPPIDSFTVSAKVQSSKLKQVLVHNDMLQDKVILPKTNLSMEDQELISKSVSYLDEIGAAKDVAWLQSYTKSKDFAKTFGFEQYGFTGSTNFISISRDENTAIPVNGFKYLFRTDISDGDSNRVIGEVKDNNKDYILKVEGKSEDDKEVSLYNEEKKIITFKMDVIYNKFKGMEGKDSATTEELTFSQENDSAKLTLIANSLNFSDSTTAKDKYANVYIMVDIK